MYSAVKLKVPRRAANRHSNYDFRGFAVPARRPFILRLLQSRRAFPSLCVHSGYNGGAAVEESEPSVSSEHYMTSVGSPSGGLQLSQWNLTQRHIHLLTAVACAVAVSATWLFLSAIPTLLAFKRAAESLEKLMDATREELPDTMAAVRLSGMEISDLTMELSDLGQEITQGIRSSTRTVRSAEERLRQFTSISPTALMQGVPVTNQETELKGGPALAVTARNMREGIVKGRSMFQLLFSLIRFSRAALGYLARFSKKQMN